MMARDLKFEPKRLYYLYIVETKYMYMADLCYGLLRLYICQTLYISSYHEGVVWD